MESSSLTGDWTQAPCFGSLEPWPPDQPRSPSGLLIASPELFLLGQTTSRTYYNKRKDKVANGCRSPILCSDIYVYYFSIDSRKGINSYSPTIVGLFTSCILYSILYILYSIHQLYTIEALHTLKSHRTPHLLYVESKKKWHKWTYTTERDSRLINKLLADRERGN